MALSRQLAERIAAAIGEAGGWLSFERYMEMCLYEPGLGYYSNPGRVFGAGGDFVTAPELTPLFGATMARQLASWLSVVAESTGETPAILEVGAGSGVLAAQLLNALTLRGFPSLRYQILELSAERRQQQRQTLNNRAPGLLERVTWLDRMPEDFCGVVIGNEVLDAMPVHLFEWQCETAAWPSAGTPATEPATSGQVFEVGVRLGHEGFEWALQPADAAFSENVMARMPAGRPWPSGYRSEICPAQGAWLATLADSMKAGVILLLDYGFPAGEYYHPQRDRGTLMCHYRHRSHVDPFLWPGLSDITAHVDYSALARQARTAGLHALGYVSQASFLLNAGLLDELSELPREPENFWFAQAQAVQMLLSEAEMGELFKVIAFARNLEPDAVDASGFAVSNRLGRLLDG